jgi:hypothetical protein
MDLLSFPEMPGGVSPYSIRILPHLFYMDAVTTAIWLVSFDLIILSVLSLTMAYASSYHNNLDFWLKF